MLRHSSDSEPGYTRKKIGAAWGYFDGDKRVTDRAEIDRLTALALPPAYADALQEDSRDPLRGMKHPRARRRLSAAETGFLKFLKQKPRRPRRAKPANDDSKSARAA